MSTIDYLTVSYARRESSHPKEGNWLRQRGEPYGSPQRRGWARA